MLAVVLPEVEPFSPLYGGAIAKWVYQVYRRIDAERQVFSPFYKYGKVYDLEPTVWCKGSWVETRLANLIRNRSCRGLLDMPKQCLRNSYGRAVLRELGKLSPGIVHIMNSPDLAAFMSRHLAASAKIILHLQNDHLINCSEATRSVLEQRVDVFVFCSEFTKRKSLLATGMDIEKRCIVIYNGTEFDRCIHSEMASTQDRKQRILFAGRLVPEKGLHVLLDALGMIPDIGSRCELTVVGGVNFGISEDSPYSFELKRQASLLACEVNFVGPLPASDMPGVFENADLFVCPSLWDEPFGMVNVEAMAAGCPVIAFSRGGIPEAVGDAGVLIDQADASSLAIMIDRSLRCPTKMDSLRRSAIERVKNYFTWDVIATEWAKALSDISGEKVLTSDGCKF